MSKLRWACSAALLGTLAWAAQGGDSPPAPREIAQVWSSTGTAPGTQDSLAACRLASGEVRVFSTVKKENRVDILDAATGRALGSIGRSGTGPGEFRYPNGIVTARLKERTAVLIVERDNHRVQAWWADEPEWAGTFGERELVRPYGAAVSLRGDGVFLYVTQADVPPEVTVCTFRLTVDNGRVSGTLVQRFGDRVGPGVVAEAESIAIDDEFGRVLLCDEARKNVKVYDLAGNFTGVTLADGLLQGDPEGIVIWSQAREGLILLTDQQPSITVWHVFDRQALAHRGAFTGRPTIANTDGICLFPEPFGPFSHGALFAVHDDTEVRAFGLGDIGNAFSCRPAPATQPAPASHGGAPS